MASSIIVPARLEGTRPEGLALCEPLKWMRILRDGIDVIPSVKYTGDALALHAHPDGTNAKMSIVTLAWQTNTSTRTVKRALHALLGMWLICVTDRGSDHGRQEIPTTYALTSHDSLGLYTVSRDLWIKQNRGH